MDGFKSFYYEKKGKYILFFGFYLIFFIVVSIYLRSIEAKKPKEEPVDNTPITTYNLSKLIDNDYSYNIEILDDGETILFSGTKSNVDYNSFENKYFLEIYNINQLLKRSKLVDSKDNVLTYELDNTEIDDLLLTSRGEGTSKILVYVNDDTTVKKIDLDLASYLVKTDYTISINYDLGENNEDSSS